jgi:hypothetical protein
VGNGYKRVEILLLRPLSEWRSRGVGQTVQDKHCARNTPTCHHPDLVFSFVFLSLCHSDTRKICWLNQGLRRWPSHTHATVTVLTKFLWPLCHSYAQKICSLHQGLRRWPSHAHTCQLTHATETVLTNLSMPRCHSAIPALKKCVCETRHTQATATVAGQSVARYPEQGFPLSFCHSAILTHQNMLVVPCTPTPLPQPRPGCSFVTLPLCHSDTRKRCSLRHAHPRHCPPITSPELWY